MVYNKWSTIQAVEKVPVDPKSWKLGAADLFYLEKGRAIKQ